MIYGIASKVSCALFGVTAGIGLKRLYNQHLDNKIHEIVPNPLPDYRLFQIATPASRCKKIADKPKGELSGEVVQLNQAF